MKEHPVDLSGLRRTSIRIKLTQADGGVKAQVWNLLTDYSEDAMNFIAQEVQETLDRIRALQSSLSQDQLYFLVALNLAGKLYEKQQEMAEIWLQLQELDRMLEEEPDEEAD